MSFSGDGEALDLADLGGDREGEHPADPRGAHQQRDVGVVGVARPEPAVDLGDLVLEVVDQLERGGDVAAPGLGDLERGRAARGPRPRTDR